MLTISAFADEISPELKVQMNVCEAAGVHCIDVRRIGRKNVSAMTVEEGRAYRRQMDDRGFSVPCIGSPIGKIRIDEDFDAHIELLKHCFEMGRAFGTNLVRIFSFYPPEGGRIEDERDAVMERMRAMVELAESADVVLLHENERDIYGARPDGVRDIFSTVRSDHLKGIFDPGNFVCEGVAPYDDAWTQGLAELTDYFHIKDKNPSDAACVPAGEGEGQFEQIFTDLKERNWSGTMTLEPHMAADGQFGGFTGPQLFQRAADALKDLCERAGLSWR